MKSAIVSAVTAFVVTVSIISVQLFLKDDEFQELLSVSGRVEAAATFSSLEAEIASLKNQISNIENRLVDVRYHENSGASPDFREGKELLDDRMAKLEQAIDKLTSKSRNSDQKNGTTMQQRISERTHLTNELQMDERRELAEAEFDSDSGLPLGNFGSSIGDVIHEVEVIQQQGIECKNTICKVTYTTNDEMAAESEDWDWQLMEKLLERSEGKQVDIRYANDSSGNNTMYIELK